MRYAQARNRLKTGDIVLFSGRGMVSWLIRRATRSDWSHVGMVIFDEALDLAMLMESGGGWKRDVYSGKKIFGVRFLQLSDVVRSYRGRVAVRSLLDIELTEFDMATIGDVRNELAGRPYERSIRELIGCAVDIFTWANHPNLKSLFCSELIAETYQRLGLLLRPPAGWPANEYAPKDFALIQFLHRNARLGPIVEIER